VRPFGLQVQLDEPLVEGLVPSDSLPRGPYRLDPTETALVGPERSFAVGSALELRIGAVDVEDGLIEFELDDARPVEPVAPRPGTARRSVGQGRTRRRS
jgi:ribonuclease R